MLLLLIGLTWCMSSVTGYIPPWSPICSQDKKFTNACSFGNMTVTLFSKTMQPKDCNSQVNKKEFVHPPVIHINSTNATDRFTVMMINRGPTGTGPDFLQWLVTNVSVTSLPNFMNIPFNDVIQSYNSTLPKQQTLVQILVFRHHNVLRVPFGELWVKVAQDFSLSLLLSITMPNLRLCGPVAGTQYWVFDSDFTPSAPPAPSQPGMQPVQPIYVPMVPVYPAGQVPVPAPAPIPGAQPAAPASSQHQHTHVTFPKKSSGSSSQPMETLFVPLVILVVMYL